MDLIAYIKEGEDFEEICSLEEYYAPHIENWLISMLPYPPGDVPYRIQLEDLIELSELIEYLLTKRKENDTKWTLRALRYLGKVNVYTREQYWLSLQYFLEKLQNMTELLCKKKEQGYEIWIDFYPEKQ